MPVTSKEQKMAHIAVKNPLDPQVLKAAGVPLDDALWFAQVPGNRKVAALMCARGKRILQQVQRHTMRLAA